MTPGAATGVWTFCFAMFFLGIGEAANFPACNKTVAEWFPKKERALAFGIFNSGANIGNMAVPVLVPALVFGVGWRGAFVTAGSLGLVWLCFWLWLYRKPEEHRKVSGRELAHIQSDPPEKTGKVPWARILPVKETWAFAVAKMPYRPHLVVLPLLAAPLPAGNLPLEHQHQPDSRHRGLPHLLHRQYQRRDGSPPPCSGAAGVSMPRAKPPLLICALDGPAGPLRAIRHEPLGGGGAGWSGGGGAPGLVGQPVYARLRPVSQNGGGSVTGFGGMAGAIAGAGFQLATGYIVLWTNSYVPLFIIAGLAYVTALLVIQILSPKLAPANAGLRWRDHPPGERPFAISLVRATKSRLTRTTKWRVSPMRWRARAAS